MKRTKRGGGSDLDDLIEQITVDANGDPEQLWAFRQSFENDVAVPCDATVVGVPVEILKFDFDGNERRGLTALCRRDGALHVVALSELQILLTEPGGRHLAAYRRWMGLPQIRPSRQRKTVAPLELAVLSVDRKIARCRQLGGQEVWLQTRGPGYLAPGQIVVVKPGRRWIDGHPHLSGTIESIRLDAAALGLDPLRLPAAGIWNPVEHPWGEDGEPVEAWAKPLIAAGPRPMFEMESVVPGMVVADPVSDPIGDSNDLKESGDRDGASRLLMDLCYADLRCLDAHSHLGNLAFDNLPQLAIHHYEAGLRIGELSFYAAFDGVLPWGLIDNRPFLRCLHGYGLCLWRLHRFDEAARIFERMLRLNPFDNQGVRLVIGAVRRKRIWDASY